MAIQIFNIKTHSKEWYDFREKGIGGSEQATIHNLNFYDTGMRLWAEKCGYVPRAEFDNESMFHGRKHEDYILDVWRFWDGTSDGYIKNYTAGNSIRTYSKVEGYLVNDKYPYLFASLDAVIDVGNANLLTGAILEKRGVLECKTISEMAAKSWESGIPLSYIMQVHQYLLVNELEYAEVAILQGGNKFYVMPIERREKICDQIIKESKSFWYDRVLPARELVNQIKNGGDFAEIESRLLNLQPDPDASDACRDYLKSQYHREYEKMMGTPEMLAIARAEKESSALMKQHETEKNRLRNILINEFVCCL